MSFVFEVVCQAIQFGVIVNNIFHVFDGNESESPDQVADVFETFFLPEIAVQQTDSYLWESITVTPLDVANPADPIIRLITIAGSDAASDMPIGNHIWVKLKSDDNGFKSGGKMMGGFSENVNADGQVVAGPLAAIQTVFDDLLTDLVVAGLALCIYRPTLSTPGLPQISTSSEVTVKGWGSNNRRQRPFQV